MNERRKKLLKFCKKIDCDTLVALEPENLFYLTGFWGEAIGILEKGQKTTIIAPALEADRAKEESVDCEIIPTERGSEFLSTLISKIKSRKPCTDCNNFSMMNSLIQSVPNIKHSSEPFTLSRIIKSPNEIQILKKASKTIDEMFDLCTKSIKSGQRESELQAILMSYAANHELFDTGYSSTMNPLIIAGGPNGALPHAQVTKRKFVKGDLIVIDLTLRYKGYVSDATRTFALGNVSEESKNVYEIVKESQKLGLKSVKKNSTCKSVDDACRSYIEKEGFGKYFIHSTGHGIGLDVHEAPTISINSKTKLSENMAITVEPGIYLKNKFGVRIEDSLIVKDKPVLLHKFTKELVII